MRARHPFLVYPAILGALALGACNLTPSVGVGVGIPHTPIGVGVGVPLTKGKSGFATRPVIIDSQPTGAEIFVNNQLVGSTPTTVQIPFTRGFWGQATGTARVVAKKPGYLAEGVTVYPAASGRVKTTPAGEAVDRFTIDLRPGQ